MFRFIRSAGLLMFVLIFGIAGDVFAQSDPDVSDLILANPAAPGAPRITNASGTIQAIVRLTDPPLAAMVGSNAKRTGFQLSADQQRAYIQMLSDKQNALMQSIAAVGGSEVTRVTRASNSLIVNVDSARLANIAGLPNVATIRLVADYTKSLSTTVPYVGASALQNMGVDGTGIRVAVLDSGIDYTHRNLDGPGTAAAYLAAYGSSPSDPKNKTLDGLFPTSKVVGGYDFVGEAWPNGPLAPDPDPIDCGPTTFNPPCDGGHGTHVADIIGGHSLDGLHKGVAPGAKLLAVKVCSVVSTACSGIALLQGIDFALDPNGDGDLSDAVDVINMSLGQDYGSREDDLSLAAAIASRMGVVVVAAAGNEGDRPYILASPAATPEVIGVAQTQVPTAVVIPLVVNSPASIAGIYNNTATVDWAPVAGSTTGTVVYVGRGCPADGATPADPYLDNPAGKIALIDRGVCAVSPKVDRAAAAGAIAVLIGQNVAGDATTFSYGGGTMFVPTLIIQQSLSNSIKSNISAPVNVTLSTANAVPLAGSMANTSARGPGLSYNAAKPDIGAPGASISALAGTGTGDEAFGGTSGATPMVSGAAALLIQLFPAISPVEVKARLMNSAFTNVLINPATQPGVIAPITSIGGGELRVNTAANISTAAWDAGDPASVSLSFGQYRTFGTTSYKKKVLVRNYSNSSRTYSIVPSFRYANDVGGAVTLSVPPSVTVPAKGSSTFVVTLNINAALLPTWNLNGGSQGGNGPLLQGVEFDGYLRLTGGGDTVSLPWHILPHKAANVRPSSQSIQLSGGTGNLTLTNNGGSIAGRIDAFALTGTSPKLPASALPNPGDNFAIIDLKSVGVRAVTSGGAPAVQFAINTWGERSHPNYPAEFDIYIDTNRDGTPDFAIFNLENGGFAATGQNVVGVANLRTNTVIARFFSDADLDSGNIILTALLSDMGMSSASQFDFVVFAFDNYFTGSLTDSIGLSPATPMTVQLNLPRFAAAGVPASIAVGGSANITVTAPLGGDVASPSQTGLLLLYRDAKAGVEADAISVLP